MTDNNPTGRAPVHIQRVLLAKAIVGLWTGNIELVAQGRTHVTVGEKELVESGINPDIGARAYLAHAEKSRCSCSNYREFNSCEHVIAGELIQENLLTVEAA